MTKGELYEENAALRQALFELRELLDETLIFYTQDNPVEAEVDAEGDEPLDDDADD